jgi:cytidine deaminase
MPSPLPAPTLRRLEQTAREISASAYAPYSGFRVGSAVLGESGKIYAGCNVENASYGLCHCAERTAIVSAVAAGERKFTAVVVYTPTPTPTAPCGACRQVIHEFAPDAVVVSICDSKARLETTLPALLTHAFGPADLSAKPDASKARGKR